MNNPCWIVKAVQPLPDYRLLITFEKGEKKVFDFKPYLKYKINEPLKNPAFFEKAYADGTTVAWNDSLDFCPETLYEESIAYKDHDGL